MGQYWTATRHEPYPWERGIADVSYAARGIQGWIELKCLPEWPVRQDTIVKIDHFTPQQRIWLYRRGEYGKHTYLLVQVGIEWLLFDHREAQKVGHELTRQGMERLTYGKMWIGRPPMVEFLNAITR